MKIFRWLAVTFSLYSKIPLPVFIWKEDDYSHSLVFFPIVGVVIGILIFFINCANSMETLPVAVRILITMVVPLVVTGGFHVDGFMDVEDALHSYAGREKKLEILKDPHVGAFAVISLLKWELGYGAAITAILLSRKCDMKVMLILGLTFVMSRCLSGLTSILFKKARDKGMLYDETKSNQKVAVVSLCIQLAMACVAALYFNPVYGAAVIAVFALYTAYYRYLAYREFGGVTGDTAGFFLTTGEIVSAVALAIVVYLF